MPKFTLQELSDRAEITDQINLYGRGVAYRDIELLLSLFTDDAVLDYYGNEPIAGADAIRAKFGGALTSADKKPSALPLDEHVVSTPIMANVIIELDGDEAHSTSYCLATHAGRRNEEGVVLINGTWNDDQWRRTDDGWKISHRLHAKMWSMELPGKPGSRHQL
jgi:ketosteroid isomerase-like protein